MIIKIDFAGKGSLLTYPDNIILSPTNSNSDNDSLIHFITINKVKYNTIWTGHCNMNILNNGIVQFPIYDITRISSRSNEYETDEPWNIIATEPEGVFSYEKWKHFINLVETYLKDYLYSKK